MKHIADTKTRRQRRIRAKVRGTKEAPRLSVFRSNKFMYAQLIDDVSAKTLIGVTEKHLPDGQGTKAETAKKLGIFLAQKAKEQKITKAVFDKGSYAYHGRVKNFADGAREGGLIF